MSEESPEGPYEAHPAGMHDDQGVVYKIGPRGGRYFIAAYWYLGTAKSVARMMNAYHGMEK